MKLKLLIHLYTRTPKDRHFFNTCLFSIYKFNNLFFLSFITLLYGCNSKTKSSISIVKEVIFNTRSGSDCPEIYYEKELKKEVIYFVDIATEKKIKFFNKNGVLLSTTPLNEVLKNIDNIGKITVVSFDTIIINSNYTNEILIANRLGKIWKKISLKDNLVDSLGNQYELFSSIYPINQNPKSLLYGASWRSNLNDIKMNKVPESDIESSEYFNRKVSETAFFINIKNIVSEKPEIHFKYYGFYKNISAKKCVFAELPSYFPIEESVFINSFYSNHIYKLNRENFNLEKNSIISSGYTSIGTNPIIINENVLGKIQDSMTFKQKTAGIIVKILFNKLKSEYYLIVRHNCMVRDFDKHTIPFSIIVLDKDLLKKSEYKFDDFKYKYYYTLLCTEGLLLFKNDTTKKLIEDEKVICDLVNLH